MKRATKRYIKYCAAILSFVFAVVFISRNGLKSSNNSIKTSEVKVINKDENEMVDWHNYEFLEKERKRVGPGEHGVAFDLSSLDKDEKMRLFSANGFNAAASRKIAIDRALSDLRHPGCKTQKYLKNLPTASVIVPFHNEDNSTLIRTATSAINRAPDHLLHEVILVDDFSNKDVLKADLDAYVKKYLPKVKIVRASKREGLIRARSLGAKVATGDVLIFLDSHTEASTNWLPPLLDPIARDPRTVVCPFIDVLDFDTLAYRPQDEGARGAFDWELYYKRLPLLPDDLKHPTRPFQSPVMAGGLFAINREWFWTLGGYDEGLDIWGGEQYELSFKIWQCGGQMLDAPCSRIGHIYRKFAPFPNPGIGDFLSKNFKRVIMAWMDEYGEYIYKRKSNLRNVDPGDISKSLAIRQKLNCKPFKWFMKEVAFDLMIKYPPVEPPDYASGEIRGVSHGLCIDTKFQHENSRFGLNKCMKDHKDVSGEQQFKLGWHKDIRPLDGARRVCFDVSTSVDHAPILLYQCHGGQGNQKWKYLQDKQQLHHIISNACLDCDPERKEIFMSRCDDSSQTQKWKIEFVNQTALSVYDAAPI